MLPREIRMQVQAGDAAAARGEPAGLHVLRVVARHPGRVHAEHVRPDGTRCCVKAFAEPEWRTFAQYSNVERVWYEPAPARPSA